MNSRRAIRFFFRNCRPHSRSWEKNDTVSGWVSQLSQKKDLMGFSASLGGSLRDMGMTFFTHKWYTYSCAFVVAYKSTRVIISICVCVRGISILITYLIITETGTTVEVLTYTRLPCRCRTDLVQRFVSIKVSLPVELYL